MSETSEKRPNAIQTYWQGLPANLRRNLWLMVVVGAVLGGLFLFVGTGNDPKRTKRVDRNDVSREVFTRANPRDLNLHGLAAKVADLEKENKLLKKNFNDLQDRTKANPDDQAKELEKIRMIQDQAAQLALAEMEKRYASQITTLEKRLNERPAPALAQAPEPVATFTPDAAGNPPGAGPVSPTAADVNWQVKGTPGQPVQVTQGKDGQGAAARKPVKMRQIVDEAAKAADEEEARAKAAKKEKEKSLDVPIPAGSIFSGTLITGLDAPTGTGAMKSPYPSLLRVKKEAILPNRYRADVRECFLIASGYGDLSSERVYFRAETISCVRNDGGVIEAPIDMYGVGEDGKAGVRGVLDTKQGQFLAKALAAGFLESVASVFNTNPVPTIATTAGTTTPFQKVFSAEAGQSAGIKGFGSAMDRLANFYIDMAQGVFPIIQVDAGRQLDFVMTRGTTLKLK